MADEALVCGIYRIDGPNGKVYIGSSIDIPRRWRLHRSELNRGIHSCAHLQRAWTKHGEAAFTFSVVELVPNADQVLRVEQRWLDNLFAKTPRSLIYNRSRRATSRRGVKASSETKQKQAVIGRQQWEAKTDAEREQVRALLSEHHRRAIQKSADKRRKPKVKQQLLIGPEVGKKRTSDVLEAQSRAHRRGEVFTMIAPDGTVYHDIPSMSGFAREHGISLGAIHNILRGKCVNKAGWRGYVTRE